MKALKTGLVSVAMLATTMAVPAFAADLSYGGSLKDEPIHEAPAAVGGCYVRADLGYGWNDADAVEINANEIPYQTVSLDDSVTWGLGAGCARASGLRYELMYTSHGDNTYSGIPQPPDPIFADIDSHSLMANLFSWKL